MRPPATLLTGFFGVAAMVCVAWVVHAESAQQFNTATRGGGQDFAYRYTTYAGDSQTLQFRLNLDDIQRGGTEFGRIEDTSLQAFRIAAMQKQAGALSNRNLKIRLTPQGETAVAISIEGLGYSQQQLAAIHQQLEDTNRTANEEYLKRQMRKVVKTNGVTYVTQPDYPAIAIRYTAAMQPVAQALMQQVPGASQNPRAFINAALGWLQTIPYDTLEDRTTSNGAGFQTPYGLIQGNLGDCDTKTVALASLIRAAYPSVPLAVITLPDHAFLGIGLPQGESDYALSTSSGIYILADPTGPRLSPLGNVDEETRARLKYRASQTETLPIR